MITIAERNSVLGPLQLIHRLHVVSKAVFGHLSPELGTVGTGMPGMYSAPACAFRSSRAFNLRRVATTRSPRPNQTESEEAT
jgi:hypothetical protein